MTTTYDTAPPLWENLANPPAGGLSATERAALAALAETDLLHTN